MLVNSSKITSTRKSFSTIPTFVDVPDLLEIQTKAFQRFLQEWTPQEARKPYGLEGVLQSVFPIEDSHRNYILEYKTYFLEKVKNPKGIKIHEITKPNGVLEAIA